MATTHTRFGKFLNHYRALDRAKRLASTPVMRMESNGDLALKMFPGGNLKKLRSRLKALEFDILLLSAGGNDFADEFLRDTFRMAGKMTPEQALQRGYCH